MNSRASFMFSLKNDFARHRSATRRNMIPIYRQEKSLHGHALDVLKSGLQKYIRRGNVAGAMYCLGELDCFSDCGRDGERIRTNMIHRLMIIYVEDIGLGGVDSWPQIHAMVFDWLQHREKTDILQRLVQLLCASAKTRACSFARAYAREHSTKCTDYQMLLAVQEKNWSSIGALLDRLPSTASLKEYKNVAFILQQAHVPYVDIAMAWAREVKTMERPLFLLLPLLSYLFEGMSIGLCAEWIEDREWEKHRAAPVWEFDDFVFDKHTRSKPALNNQRTREYFVNVSSQVQNEVFLTPPIFAELYRGGGTETKQQLETDYDLVVRCQLVTSASKTDTVIARGGRFVFLKGPFKRKETVERYLRLQEEKRQRGIPTVGGQLVWLVPNRWASTPLGIRNQLDATRAWPFLVTPVLFDREQIRTCMAASVKWPETEVLDAAAMKLTIDPFHLTSDEMKDYVAAIKFRLEFNLGDFADRNFLRGADGRIYSVDEDVTQRRIDLEKALKKRRYALIKEYL